MPTARPGWPTWNSAWAWPGRDGSVPRRSSTRVRSRSFSPSPGSGGLDDRPYPGAPPPRPPPAAPMDRVLALLKSAYPEAHCALDHLTPFELLVATILSAQCTDLRVNMVTPALFARYPTAKALAEADQSEVEELIRSTGFFRNKARNLIGMATALVERHRGEVPADMEALRVLPGVGRKTANVVLGNAFGINDGIRSDRDGDRPGGAAPGRGAGRHGSAPGSPWSGPEDGERRTGECLRDQRRHHGRYPCRPAVEAARAHPAHRPDQGRT